MGANGDLLAGDDGVEAGAVLAAAEDAVPVGDVVVYEIVVSPGSEKDWWIMKQGRAECWVGKWKRLVTGV